MCSSGIPVLDVFQMTESAPPGDEESVIRNTAKILTQYFKAHPTKECIKRTETKKPVNSKMLEAFTNDL